MSSARISAHEGAGEVLPSTAAAHRAGDADPADGFAAALGALTANSGPSSDHPTHGGDDQASAQGTGDPKFATGNTAGNANDAIGGDPDATTGATLPPLGGWLVGSGIRIALGVATSGHRHGTAHHSATTSGAAVGDVGPAAASVVGAAAVAASLDAFGTAAATAAVSSTVTAMGNAQQSGLAAAPLTQSGDKAPVPATAASSAGRPDAASIGSGGPVTAPAAVAPTGDTAAVKMAHTSLSDPTAQAVPGATGDAALQMPDLSAPDPASAVVAADPSASPPAQAGASRAPPVPLSAAVLAAAAPAVAAMVNPVASSDSRSGAHDFANTARDGQAAAAVAFSGVAGAGISTATAGGVGAPSVDAGAVSGPSLGADAGNVATQLSGQLLRLLANSGHEAVVRLHPPDLGEVTVRVAVSGRDVSAWFGSSQPAVQQSISSGLGQLQTDLGNAGYSLNNAWVGADASGSGARGEAPPPAPIVMPTQAAPILPIAAAPSSNSGVSIYV